MHPLRHRMVGVLTVMAPVAEDLTPNTLALEFAPAASAYVSQSTGRVR